ncbi:MAG: glycosyltransferase [Candidatus Kaiserbacteria bacterium]|nr:glycosyltransferase [Candidatus Kaiserbacteria bacterium]
MNNTTPTHRIRVVIVINDFLIGGAQKLLVDMLRRFDKNHFTIILVTLFQFQGRDTFYNLLPPETVLYKLDFKGFADIKSWFAFAKVLRKERPDVVMSNLFFSNTVSRILKPFFGYHCISVEHNTYKDKSRWAQLIDWILSYITDTIVAVSATVKTFTVAQEKIPASKFKVINNGIDIHAIQDEIMMYDRSSLKEELGLNQNRHYIINIARLTQQKNHALLLNGFALFSAKNPDYELVIVGDGGLRTSLEKQTEKLKIKSQVHFFGSRTDVTRFYSISDFFVSTSFIEGFPLAHTEALACGLPVVSTKTAGSDAMIEEGKNGFFISGETSEAVAAALNRMVVAQPDSMRAYSRQVASHYDIDSMVREYEDLIIEASV